MVTQESIRDQALMEVSPQNLEGGHTDWECYSLEDSGLSNPSLTLSQVGEECVTSCVMNYSAEEKPMALCVEELTHYPIMSKRLPENDESALRHVDVRWLLKLGAPAP